jgi:hypothetical protein
MAERKAAKAPPKKSERQLTDKIVAAKGKEDDPAAKVMQAEAIWEWLLENAKHEQKVELHMLRAEQRAELIELSREQYEREHDEPSTASGRATRGR